MRSSAFVAAVLAVVCAARPSAAFLQDLLLQPLQHIQHAVQPQYPQYPQQPQYPQPQYQQYPQQPQYYQYSQYRRASDVHTVPLQTVQAVQPVQHGVYAANSRPAAYQWQPNSYGSGYSYSSGSPLSSLLPTSWFPWAGRQPAQPQPVVAAQQPPQPQQPLQAFWALLPWNSNNVNNGGAQQQPGPILSFLQNPAAALPWGLQAARPGVVYSTPLAPSAAVAAAPVSASLAAAPAAMPGLQVVSEAAAAPSVKPTGVVLDDLPATASFSGNGIRRIALHDVHPDAVQDQDALPCAQDA